MRQQERDESAFLAQTVIEILLGSSQERVRKQKQRADLPKWLAIPEADNGDRDARNQAVAREAKGEV
jgi:hypothetical protein